MSAVKDGKKTCRRCEWNLPVAEFNPHPNGGYQSWCKMCTNGYNKNVRIINRQLKDENITRITLPFDLTDREQELFIADARRVLKDPTWVP